MKIWFLEFSNVYKYFKTIFSNTYLRFSVPLKEWAMTIQSFDLCFVFFTLNYLVDSFFFNVENYLLNNLKKKVTLLIWKTQVCIAIEHSLYGTKISSKYSKIWSVFLFKNTKIRFWIAVWLKEKTKKGCLTMLGE